MGLGHVDAPYHQCGIEMEQQKTPRGMGPMLSVIRYRPMMTDVEKILVTTPSQSIGLCRQVYSVFYGQEATLNIEGKLVVI